MLATAPPYFSEVRLVIFTLVMVKLPLLMLNIAPPSLDAEAS